MNMCLLEVAMCEKCRGSNFQLEGGVKSLRMGRGVKILGLAEGYQFDEALLLGQGSVPHCMPWNIKSLLVNSMKKWKVMLCSGNSELGEVEFK